MIACLDVDYRDTEAIAACVLFREWDDEGPVAEVVVRVGDVRPYEPGRFYLRELPCLLAVLESVGDLPETILIDGYVWLAGEHEPGLGAHLFEELDGRAAVIGVAKTRFLRAGVVAEVLRGGSLSPLYITAAGLDVQEAARLVRAMHGPFRIPTLLKRVDRLCRDAAGGP